MGYFLRIDYTDASVNSATPDGDLTAARTRLCAAAGGLGVTSAVATSPSAYLGSLCLTAHYAKQAIGAVPDDAARLAVAFPHLAAAVAAAAFASIPHLAGATLVAIAAEPFKYVQHKLTRNSNKAAFDDVFARIVDPEAKAWLLSGQRDGATFLTAYPEFGGGLTDLQFVTLVKARLGLQVVDGCGKPMQCPACSGLRAYGTATLRPDVTVLRPDGLHALHCREQGKGGLMGMTSSRHKHLKFTVINVIQRYGSKTAVVHAVEPVVTDFGYALKPDAQPVRGDIAVTTNGVTTILDAVVSHPHAAHEPRVASTPGLMAELSHSKKANLYNSTYDIPSGHMVPLSAETGGQLNAEFTGYVKGVIVAGLAVGGAAATEWTPVTRVEFSSRYRSALVAINLAIARSVSIALIRGSTTPVRYARGAPGPPAAA